MYITTKSGRKVYLPTDEEDVEINRGIAADSDTFEPTDEHFKKFKPIGRPKAEVTKKQITLRLSLDVVESFKATGKGWQTRIDEALKEWLRERPR